MLKITVRTDKETSRPVIFFYNQSKISKNYWLECYDNIGQHSTASIEYMRDCTAPMPVLTAEAERLVKEWASGEDVQIMQRLPKPKV